MLLRCRSGAKEGQRGSEGLLAGSARWQGPRWQRPRLRHSRASPAEPSPGTQRAPQRVAGYGVVTLLPFLPQSSSSLAPAPPSRKSSVLTGGKFKRKQAKVAQAASLPYGPGMRNAVDTRDAGHLGYVLQGDSAPSTRLNLKPHFSASSECLDAFSPSQPRPRKESFGCKAKLQLAAMPIQGSLTRHRVTSFTGARKPRDRSARGVRKGTWSFTTLKSTPISITPTKDAAKRCFAPAADPDELGASPNAESEQPACGEAVLGGLQGFSRGVWWSRSIPR